MELATSPAARRFGWVLTLLSAAAIGFLTLRPGGSGPPPATGAGYLTTDVVLNVVLFMPLGVGLALLGLRPTAVIGIGALASSAIELSQLWIIPGRFASLHDVATNTAGTALAAWTVVHWGTRRRWWGLLSPWILGGLTLAWVAGAFLVIPSAPRQRALWYSQWAHEFNGEQFSGRVTSFTLQGTALPNGRLPETDQLREALRTADTIRLSAAAVTGVRPSERGEIVAVIAGYGEELIGAWQRGTSLRARVRLGLSDYWLRNPWITVEEALADTAGSAVQLEILATKRWIRVTSVRDGLTRERTLALTSALFWAGFFPFDYDARRGTLWWPLLATLPAFLLLGLAGHRRLALVGGSLLISLAAAPLAAGISLPGWPLLACAALATSLGIGIARLLDL